jgi:hypothetical protein
MTLPHSTLTAYRETRLTPLLLCAVIEVRQSVIALQQAKPALMFAPQRLLKIEGVDANPSSMYGQDTPRPPIAQLLQRNQRGQDLNTSTGPEGVNRNVRRNGPGEVLEPTLSHLETATWLYRTTLRSAKILPSNVDPRVIEDDDQPTADQSNGDGEEESADGSKEAVVFGVQ